MIITNNTKELESFGHWYRKCLLENMLLIQKPIAEMVELYNKNKNYFKKS